MSYPPYSKKKEFDEYVDNFDFSDRDLITSFLDENRLRFIAAHEGLYEKHYKSSSPKLRNCLIELIHWSKKGRTLYLEKMKQLENSKDILPSKKSTKKKNSKAYIDDKPKTIPTGKFPDDELEVDDTVIFQ